MRGEQKGKKGKDTEPLRHRFLGQAVKEAAHTWVNRLVMIRILEQTDVITPAVLTGGWKSPAYEKSSCTSSDPLCKTTRAVTATY